MSKKNKTFEVSVIVFREDSTWTAIALEMDVRGYGDTLRTAIDEVVEMTMAQVTFAVQMGHPESVWHPAEEKYWRMFKEARRERFVAEVSGTEPPTDRIADMVPLPLLSAIPGDEWIAARA